jgi:RNA recognition motif-containing protein
MRQEKFRGNVFVANLPNGYTDAKLAELFDAYGIVIGAFLARDPDTGASKGHGLVGIAPERAAAAAVADLNGKNIGGRRIEVRVADPDMALTIPSRRHSPSRDVSNFHARTHSALAVERRAQRRRP